MPRLTARKSANDVRPAYIALNVISNCLSSSAVEIGNTRVICAVRPPQQLVQEYRGDRGRVACEVRRVSSGGKKEDQIIEKDLSLAIEGVLEELVMLESMPQLLIEVTLQIICEDGALWDTLTTALSTALAAGGIALKSLFSSCTAALLEDGSVVVDVRKEEERKARVIVVVCASLFSKQIAYMKHQGATEISTLQQLVHTALDGAQARSEHIVSQLKEQEAC